MKSLSLEYQDGQLRILDQRLLPQKEQWVEIQSPEDMIQCIQKLQVRGAPLIGVAAAFSLAQYAKKASVDQIKEAAQALKQARPTAVNLMKAMDRLLCALEEKKDLESEAQAIFEEDRQLCERIIEWGEPLIKDGDGILTHCNTGGLATAGEGTALGVIKRAYQNKKKIHVYVTETRPLLQGGRLTTWELEKAGVPYTLIGDSMSADLMAKGKIQKVFVGADRIAANGDFANKVGTYMLAVLSHYHHCPFYVVAPMTTVDLKSQKGQDIPIEQRAAEEVKGVKGAFGQCIWAPYEASVYNPAFDVTPAHLVSAWILDRGVFEQPPQWEKL